MILRRAWAGEPVIGITDSAIVANRPIRFEEYIFPGSPFEH